MDKDLYDKGMKIRREVLLQVGVYAGIPAAVDSFRIVNEAFAEIDAEGA